jgi:hypothetical protein
LLLIHSIGGARAPAGPPSSATGDDDAPVLAAEGMVTAAGVGARLDAGAAVDAESCSTAPTSRPRELGPLPSSTAALAGWSLARVHAGRSRSGVVL